MKSMVLPWQREGNGQSPKKTTLDTFSAKCFSLFDYSSVEEAIHVLKLMLAKNCYGIFRFGPSARGLGPQKLYQLVGVGVHQLRALAPVVLLWTPSCILSRMPRLLS